MNLLIFPHQLFANHPGIARDPSRVVLIEDSLFFGDAYYPMSYHKQKLWLQRASMKRYEQMLQAKGLQTLYLEYVAKANSLKDHLKTISASMATTPSMLVVAEPTDFMLEKRLKRFCKELDIVLEFVPTPGFINHSDENREYRAGKKRWFMTDFYKFQRKRLGILMDGERPVGGKWSFDTDNRLKVPKALRNDTPRIPELQRDSIDREAVGYVERRFPDNPGSLAHLYYPTSHAAARQWLSSFLNHRFEKFGFYEDAMLENESWLWHSVLTPSLNLGLLPPKQVVEETLDSVAQHTVPINSLEGFIRQIIGWREFVRATYEDIGVQMRTSNHWNHKRKIPRSFYDGTTGIAPIDDTISRILNTGYCHHIERLMVLGGFMFLCEFDVDEIYRWFMEMFVDSYDWVMVPNVYAMSQHSAGGLITTKPYFSGSSYIRKMSNYKSGPWCDVWDGLYWSWIMKHADSLAKNPRWAMMCSASAKMSPEKRKRHVTNANAFLDRIAV